MKNKIGSEGLYLDQLEVGNKPSLAHLDVVDGLVRDFVAGVLAVRSGFAMGHASAKSPLNAIEEKARELSRVFLGQDQSYVAQPFNAENRLGYRLAVLLPDETKHYGDSVTGLFMWLAAQTINAAKAQDGGRPEYEVRTELAEITDDVVQRLIGAK